VQPSHYSFREVQGKKTRVAHRYERKSFKNN
jgi:hypothetical protein